MNDSDSVKKLIMDSACKVALDEHLDEVNFNLKPQEHSYRDCMTVIFGKGRKRISTIFMMGVKQYDKHEAETLAAIVEGRGSAGDIENATTAIAAVSEAYPELKADENYRELMNELAMTENLIAEYRSNYNKQVKAYNRYVKKFPTRIFLNMLGYERQSYQYLDYEAPVDAPQNLFGED